jgi:hypothetical protein
VLYHTDGLHYKRHGGTFSGLLPAAEQIMVSRGISCARIAHPFPPINQYPGVTSCNGITVLDSYSRSLSRLHSNLAGGHLLFQNSFANHLLQTMPSADRSRFVVPADRSQMDYFNTRLQFGWKRLQKVGPKTIYHNHQKLPTMNTSQFLHLPLDLRKSLMQVLESVSKILMDHDKTAFRCPHRTGIFASKFNSALGFPRSSNKFEYVEAVLSFNTELPGHLDTKDDHRTGYTRTSVYSYTTIISNKNYRLAIIMCTRSSVGACLETILSKEQTNLKCKNNY